jgi:polar amino acid transport system permease protein
MTFSTSLKTPDLSQSRPNPQKSNILIQRLVRAPWWLLFILGMVLLLWMGVAENALYQGAWQEVKKGLEVTIRVTVVAYSLALIMGLILALLRRRSTSVIYNLLIYQPVTAWVELIRGIPTLVLVFYIVLALIPELVKIGNDIGTDLVKEGIDPIGIPAYLEQLKIRDVDPEYRAVIALAMSYSAFLSEIFRAGIESIDDGQRQAARSLGMSGWQVMRLVILPQAIRNILPPLGNDFIAMLKESSLVSVVGVADITRKGRDFGAATFTVFPGYNTIAMTYLVLTLVLSMLVKGLEWYLGRSRQQRG